MPYIGKSPHFGVRNRFIYTATGDETSKSGADDNGATLTFTDGAYVDVYLNGVLLKPDTDYVTTTANTIGSLSALSTSDILEVIVYDVFSVSDTVSAASGGTFQGAVGFNGGVSTALTPSSADGVALGSASLEWSDLYLADGGVIYFGNDQDVTITHDPDDGLILKSAATTDDNPFLLTLQTGETDLAANDVIGKIAFQAPDEGTGTDAILVSGAIQARAEGDHSSSSNATSLDFMTGASEAATTKMTITSGGDVGIGTTDPSSQHSPELVFSAGSNGGVTIYNANSAHAGGISFSDATSGTGRYAGYIQYQHNDNAMTFGTSSTERMRILSGGDIVVGRTSNDLTAAGVSIEAAGTGGFVRSAGPCLILNRLSTDGEVIRINKDATTIGTIAVDGSDVDYNTFLGSHWSRLTDNSRPTILRGTVMETIDEMCDWHQAEYTSQEEEKYEDGDNIPFDKKVGDVKKEKIISKDSIALPEGKKVGDTITHTVDGVDYTAKIIQEEDIKHAKCKVSDSADSKCVYGVFLRWDDDGAIVNDLRVASVGTYVIRIHKDQTVSKGDLLTSNGDGTAKKQDDDIIRSKTIGKVLSNVKQETYSDGSYTVPCALYCG